MLATDVNPQSPTIALHFGCRLAFPTAELYNSNYHYVFAQPHIGEFTVEDPAEVFKDHRDKSDLIMLLSHEKFTEEAFGKPESYRGGCVGGVGKAKRAGKGGEKIQARGRMVPPRRQDMAGGVEEALEDCSGAYLWWPLPLGFLWLTCSLECFQRQFQRLTEILILYKLDMSDPRITKAYRLQVKERLFRFNFVRPPNLAIRIDGAH